MVDQPFRILDHTADIGFECTGKSREDLFANAGKALVHFFVDLETIEPREELTIAVTGEDSESLLVNWLSEILFLIDADGWLLSEFQVSLRDTHSLSATARGEPWDRSRHVPKLLVKAITYHQLEITLSPDGAWHARVFLDI